MTIYGNRRFVIAGAASKINKPLPTGSIGNIYSPDPNLSPDYPTAIEPFN